MKFVITFFCFIILTMTSINAEGKKVIFIGNSYTAVWKIPKIVKGIANANGHNIDPTIITNGGKNFQFHWNHGVAAKIAKGKYDIVVLQNQSFEPVADPANMIKYGKLLVEASKKSGARTLLYLTMTYKAIPHWIETLPPAEFAKAKKLFPEMYERVLKAYKELAKVSGSEIAPVGVAWKRAYNSIPGIKLHSPDNTHPNEFGAYLSALVFYSVIFKEKPQELPDLSELKVTQRGHKPKPIPVELRKKLANIAWETAKEFVHVNK